MGSISLTAAMRSNLLSLQQIASGSSATQNRLATGLKVNSAIDNPSSYYAAKSLTNRTNDLNTLLDAMGQGIQTIKSAIETMDRAGQILNLASTITSQVKAAPADGTFFKVSSAAELKKALADTSVERIMVTRSINFDVDDQLVIGAGKEIYGLDETVELNFTLQGNREISCIEVGENVSIKNIALNVKKIDFTSTKSQLFSVNNARLFLDNVRLNSEGEATSLLVADNATIKGKFSAFSNGHRTSAIILHNNSLLDAEVTIETFLYESNGILAENSTVNGTYNIITHASESHGFNGKFSTFSGKLNFWGDISQPLLTDGNTVIKNGSKIVMGRDIDTRMIVLNITQDVSDLIYNAYSFENAYLKFQTGETVSKADFLNKADQTFNSPDPGKWDVSGIGPSYKAYQNKFYEILDQYDQMIKDASFRGVNLLQSNNLTLVFNEDGSSALEISGIDTSSKGLGISRTTWLDEKDFNKTEAELREAINQLRLYSSEFGSYYQTVESRKDFTSNLINILTEGADNLTLADMNQESANMLALQTRQQLAVNSLSLASQAAQGILKLF